MLGVVAERVEEDLRERREEEEIQMALCSAEKTNEFSDSRKGCRLEKLPNMKV